MKEYIFSKILKRILYIFILSIFIYSSLGVVPNFVVKSNAAKTNPGSTYTYKNSSNNLPSNFDSTYPGYRSVLQSIASAHPNWTFKLYETAVSYNLNVQFGCALAIDCNTDLYPGYVLSKFDGKLFEEFLYV